MSPVVRLAAINAVAVLVACLIAAFATGNLGADLLSLYSVLLLLAVSLVVFWRVSRAYRAGAVTASRAIAEGFVSGAVFAVVIQVAYWGLAALASQPALPNTASVVNLLQQASYAGALGALLGFVLWGVNARVSPRAVS